VRRRAFVVLEGGGAMGLAHLGTLRVLETHDVELRGIAGTSAGAIVAGLACVGYRASELYDPELDGCGGSPLLRSLGVRSAVELLGRTNWFRVAMLRGIAGTRDQGWRARIQSFLRGFAVIVGLHLWAGLAYLFLRQQRPGLCTMDAFIDSYDRALRHKLNERARQCGHAEIDATHKITFSDVMQRTGRILKVVTTCVDRRELALFGSLETPDVPVADAVAASASIPLLFKPVVIPGYDQNHHRHHDGGMVSNLPAWTFDHDRLFDPSVDTIVSQIVRRYDPVPTGTRGLQWLQSMARSAIFGANALNTRRIERLYRFSMPVRMGLLDFDISKQEANKEVRSFFEYADARLGFEFIEIPDILIKICDDLRELLQDALDQECYSNSSLPERGIPDRFMVRVALLEPLREQLGGSTHKADTIRMLQIKYSAGFADSPDQGMAVPIADSLVGEAWTRRRIERQILPRDGGPALEGEHNRVRRARLWPDVRWRIAAPIFTRHHSLTVHPSMILSIDGSHPPHYLKRVIDDSILEMATRQIAVALDKIAEQARQLDQRPS
jgi:NTE family protein